MNANHNNSDFKLPQVLIIWGRPWRYKTQVIKMEELIIVQNVKLYVAQDLQESCFLRHPAR